MIGSTASFVWLICSRMHHFQVAFLVLRTLVHLDHFQLVASVHLVRSAVATLNVCLSA